LAPVFARLFGISLCSVRRYARVASKGESLAPKKKGGGRPLRPMRREGISLSVPGRHLPEGSLGVE